MVRRYHSLGVPRTRRRSLLPAVTGEASTTEEEGEEGDEEEEEITYRRRRRRSLLRIIHARGAIPNEMGPTRCRATPALNQSADAGLQVPAVDLSLPFAPSWTWCPGGQTVALAGWECRLPPLELGVWAVSRVSLAGSALCPLTGRWVGQVTVGGSGEATEG